ncbi:MAG: ABC transporter permease [Beijerinckiaceae bacterium]|nr:ABC transporter permease [Beijerinckiaceae bacterium]
MIFYVIRRILYVIPIAIGVTIVCFMLIHLAPGDPLDAVLPDNAPPEMVEEVRAAYGFDKPLPVQYAYWLSRVVTGDFGRSIMTQRSVASEVFPAVLNSLTIAAAAIALALFVGVLLGALSGYRSGTLTDRAITFVATTGISVPHYWLAMVLIIVFAVNMRILPATGMGPGGSSGFAFNLENLRYMVLPAIALAVGPAAIIARSVRGTVSEIRKQDFIQTLYAKGLGPTRVFLHVAKNAAPTLLAIIGLQTAHLLGGSILVETVFSWPGAGFLLHSAIFSRDLPILQGAVLVLAMFFVATNLVVDVLQTFFDPRLRRG